MARNLDGLRAVVTGGSLGIGAAIAGGLSERGAKVAVFDLRPSPDDSIASICADASSDPSMRAAVGELIELWGGVDILVNNAQVAAVDIPDKEWLTILDVTVPQIIRNTRALLPYLRVSPAASVVNICSVQPSAGRPARGLHGAGNSAIIALTRAMAADHRRDGIRVNCISPKAADTSWTSWLSAEAEVADAIQYLVSPRSGLPVGSRVEVDGGPRNPAFDAIDGDLAR